MKILKYFALFFAIILILIYVVAFTGFGNNLVKPHLENLIKEKTGYDVKFSIFDINFGSLDIKADVNSEIFAEINGDYNLFFRNFDLDYAVDIKNLKTFGVNLKENMQTKGKINGNLDDFSVTTNGKIFDSDLKLNANLKDLKPFNIDLDAKNLNIEKILAVANLPIYAKGKIYAIANIKNGVGTANITSKDSFINKEALKDLNISVSKNINFALNSNINFKENLIKILANLNSDLANVDNLQANYDLDKKNLNANFELKIDDFNNFKDFTKQNLSGNLNGVGEISLKNNILNDAKFQAKTLGGEILINSNGKNLLARITNLNLNNIFALLLQSPLANGNLSADLNFSDIANLDGDVKFKIANGILNHTNLSKILEKEFPKNIKFNTNGDVKIKNKIANFDAILKSDLANLSKLNGKFDIKNIKLNSNFTGDLPDLSKFNSLIGQNLNGKIAFFGEANFDKILDFKLKSENVAGGKLDTKILGEKITANLNNFAIEKLTKMLNYGHFYEGVANADFKYNTNKKAGNFDILIDEGKFAKTKMINALSLATRKDLANLAYKDGKVFGTIDEKKINFNVDMVSPKSEIKVKDGKIYSQTGALDIDFKANVEKTDLNAKIYGTTKDPKYSISSDYLKGKITKELGRGINKLFGVKNDDNSTKNLQNIEKSNSVKNLIQDIGSLF